MCRFLAHLGHTEILLNELLQKPENSLIKQSHEAREGGRCGINADGFGIAWYKLDIDSEPGVFKSTQPAWNDNNLKHLSRKIRSSCFLAHVRASTVGDVNQNNCHPFAYKQYAFVHNGTIRNFDHYKRDFIQALDEDLFLKISGNTDSEHLFFLIMNFIKHGNSLEIAVKKAIAWVVNAQKNRDDFSKINIAITDGNTLIATRFSSKGEKPLSLHYNTQFFGKNKIPSLVLSSEALDDENDSWEDIPPNSYLFFSREDMKVVINPVA